MISKVIITNKDHQADNPDQEKDNNHNSNSSNSKEDKSAMADTTEATVEILQKHISEQPTKQLSAKQYLPSKKFASKRLQ